jgi:quercetin dioxygenase-like cupin family protein
MKYLAVAVLFSLAVMFGSALAQDPVKLSPNAYKVLLDNDEVRVLEFRFPAGEKEPMHSHPRGFIYLLEDGKVKSTTPDGKVEDMVLKKGEIRWREATTHAVENVGTTEVRVMVVEMKKPAK